MHKELINFYRGLIRQHGGKSVATVSYNSRETQHTRFDILIKNSVPNKTDKLTLLDLGCGLGDLYGYLQKNDYHNIDYTGIDIVPEMVSAAQRNYPDGKFKQADFVLEDIGEYDIICASGSLNILFDKVLNHASYIQEVIQKMYQHSRLACAFNLLDKDAEYLYGEDARFYYADKRYFLAYCQTLCADTRLIAGYLVNDFTLVLKH
ncbi:SAM-dependent methyltransferases [Candidatus Termititenax dinenymphae]|uniref:SAM-dependent methyltransferases n=1 Tax=Candidatus Termititenax dinenymphae TaxID=2218523 RepID=A0A388TKS9_9BACT|nr:SAM-dependent methyltransferases [Candidatus Termititenax dinenymphae]